MKKITLILVIFLTLINANYLERKLVTTLESWSEAINQRDFEALSILYAPVVIYYGKVTPKWKCIQDKKRALRKRPFFHQEIDDVSYGHIRDSIYKVGFTKYVRYTKHGKIKTYPSYLYIDLSSVIPKIVVESDRVTDINLLYK